MKCIRHTINVLIFLCVALIGWAQTESEIKENAGKLFEDEQYVEATSLYLRLLSLNPKSSDYNFRYGTCLLFNSYQKKEAIRYLNFAVKDGDIDPRAHYFYGKALHLNYQFKEAQQSYKKYISLRSKRDKRYNVEREIEMCDNGKKLLSSFTDIIVSEKKEIDQTKFFRIYGNMRTIGGTILVTAEFQSKLDKKKGHVPIVHFPPNAQAIYYSSYGNDESTGKDIYVRKRLPNNKWGDPQLVQGNVNTNEDEDFPYMHPDGVSLFFSSKGHNSMGGYDVFFSELNEEIGIFGRPENVDFAICSPDDDLFYVVDSLHENAYFASARQSQDGKLHVYRVKVDRVEIRDVIVMGDFNSEINPENKKMNVVVSDLISGEEVGTFKSVSSGKYSFVFPRGGKYEYAVTVDGSEDIYKFTVEIPFLKEFKALKQKAVHKMIDSGETVSIINLFNEDPEGSEALIAEVIRQRSELNVNVDQFDLNELDADKERNELLATMGFENMSMPEISQHLEELSLTEMLNIEKAERIDANIDGEIIQKSEALVGLEEELSNILIQANEANDPATKHRLLMEAKRIEAEKRQVGEEITTLNTIRTDVLGSINGVSDGGIGKISVVENQFNALMSSGKEDEAMKLLADNVEVINQTRESSPQSYVNILVENSVQLSEEIKILKTKENELGADEHRLESAINTLKNELATTTKKKDLDRLDEEIASKEEELAAVKELLEITQDSIEEKQLELSVLDNNIASIQKAMLEDPVAIDGTKDIEELIADATEAATEAEAIEIDQQLEELISTNPELNPDFVAVVEIDSQVEAIKELQAEQAQEIKNNDDLTEQEQLNQLIENNSEAIQKANDRIEEIDQTINENGTASGLEEEKERLEEFKDERIKENASFNEELNSIEQPIDVALSPEDVIKEIDKKYVNEIEKIKSDAGLTEKEKLTALQELDNNLLNDLNEEIASIDKGLDSNPEDPELTVRKEIVQGIIEEKQGVVAERTQTINAMENVSSVTSPQEVQAEIESGLTDNAEEQNAIEASDKTEFEKSNELLELDVNRLDELKDLKEEISKEFDRNPEDATLKTRLDVVNQMVESQEKVIAKRVEEIVNTITAEELSEIVDGVDRKYSVDIGELNQSTSPTKHKDIAEREGDLQGELEKAIEKANKELEKNPTAGAQIDLALYERALNESKEREAAALSIETIPVDVVDRSEEKEDFISELRNTSLDDGTAIEATHSTKSELEAQEQALAVYETELENKIEEVTDDLSDDPENTELQEKLVWLEEEKEAVVTKRRSISVTIGELETDIAQNNTENENTSNSTSEDEAIQELDAQANDIVAQLENPELTNKEKRNLEEALDAVQNEIVARENVINTEEISNDQATNEALDGTLAKMEDEDGSSEVVSQARTYNASETAAIQELVENASEAKSEEERSYLLNEAKTRQETLNDDMKSVIASERQHDIEEENNIELQSKEELEKQRRTFTVQIGELTTDIINKEKEIDGAKKKEVPALTEELNALITERTVVETRLRRVEEALLEQTTSQPVVSDEAAATEITFNEEREIAATEVYEEYYELGAKALEEEQQIATLEVELNQVRTSVNNLLLEPRTPENEAAIEAGVLRVKELEAKIDALNIELVQSKYAAEAVLPDNEEESMRMKNLLIRGVKPLKTTVVAAALINLPSSGLAIDSAPTESVYTEANPIPVGVEAPSGLVYRVQIGAFSKPIPQDLFKEFNPVSGELIGGTNVTRYMAGYFNNSDVVVDAREQIRALGYSDAFVVAYCDGERIGFGDARRREEQGTCVPKGSNEIMMEVATNTAETMGIPLTNEVQEVPEHTYNEAPGAVDADPIEIKQGLFFTVQIGVFNRPVGDEYTYGMAELMTIRLPNGQIRYASGMFDSVEDALPRRKEALNKGVKGAFVTAYFEGERITLAEAKRLLAERGSSILQSEIEKKEVEPEPIVETPVVIRTDTVTTVNIKPVEPIVGEQRIQIVTKKKFDEFPRDVLNRYNAEGTFFFDENDSLVKSIIYKHVDFLPRLWNFRDDIDTVYLNMDESDLDSVIILEVKFTDSVIPGDFIDWLLRFNYRREFVRVDGVSTLRIFGVERIKVKEVQAIIRKFALEATEVEETEHELELEEH